MAGKRKASAWKIAATLRGGHRRSIGKSNEVAARAMKSRKTFYELFRAMWHSDERVRMRATDAAEKASAARPELLTPFKAELLGLIGEASQQELRWHLAAMVPRLSLTRGERLRAAAALRNYLVDKSSIVRTFAMQGMVDLAEQDESMRTEAIGIVAAALKSGTPAMKARARMLRKRIEATWIE